MASLLPIPQQTLYGAAKHGVLGLFRSLRITAFAKGVRVNMICPYFADTGILTPPGRILPAGAHLAQLEDVDQREELGGGPSFKNSQTEQGEWQYCRQEESEDAMEVSLWEVRNRMTLNLLAHVIRGPAEVPQFRSRPAYYRTA
ncbi:hypothetical protein V1524DRAFT_405106 [Lipomyces starkeyi]